MAAGEIGGLGGSGSSGSSGSAEVSRLISLRVPVAMLEDLRRHAARRAMPYQSLLKHWLSERLEEESFRLERHRAEVSAAGGLVGAVVVQGQGAATAGPSLPGGVDLSGRQEPRGRDGGGLRSGLDSEDPEADSS